MIHNMGKADRVVRAVIGFAALAVTLLVGLGTIVGTGLLVVAAIMFVTAAVGFCPTYLLLRISTNPTVHRTSMPEPKLLTHH